MTESTLRSIDPKLRAHFDREVDRSQTNATKWLKFPADVLPFWIADMDFAAPEFLTQAIAERLAHPIIGYTDVTPGLIEAFQQWLKQYYDWEVPSSWLVWLPGVVPGLNLAAMAALNGGGVLMPTPVYYPFLEVPEHCNAAALHAPLVLRGRTWEMDFARLEQLAPQADVLLLCNPQNPSGRCYSSAELNQLAELCLRHDVTLVSDEIHSAILLEPHAQHVPIARLVPELQANSVSLYAPTKTYNFPGLSCAVAVIPEPKLRNRFRAARQGLLASPGPLAYAAAEAAFRDRGPWVPALNAYLAENLAALREVVGSRLANLEATYLAWIDVRDLVDQGLVTLGQEQAYFQRFGLGLSPGSQFAGPGFVRFNFAVPRSQLVRGLERLRRALSNDKALK